MRERCPNERRSSGANQRAERSGAGWEEGVLSVSATTGISLNGRLGKWGMKKSHQRGWVRTWGNTPAGVMVWCVMAFGSKGQRVIALGSAGPGARAQWPRDGDHPEKRPDSTRGRGRPASPDPRAARGIRAMCVVGGRRHVPSLHGKSAAVSGEISPAAAASFHFPLATPENSHRASARGAPVAN